MVEEHDDLGLGQVVGAQALEELGDALGGVGDGVVAEGAGAGAEVLEGLRRLESMNDAFFRAVFLGRESIVLRFPFGSTYSTSQHGVV